eukprot:TRINITY_DN2516_c0_g2_i1.p1 TRINITY_DN2516_c0_g2~~TRINITY_DN2516_c0_g2_i1.p1  ORF type:complete len:212 (-),score=26.71 TRINITY_DN2516_c0_g2_i1:159-746(-)
MDTTPRRSVRQRRPRSPASDEVGTPRSLLTAKTNAPPRIASSPTSATLPFAEKEPTRSSGAGSCAIAATAEGAEDAAESTPLLITSAGSSGGIEFLLDGKIYRVADLQAFNELLVEAPPPERSVAGLALAQRACRSAAPVANTMSQPQVTAVPSYADVEPTYRTPFGASLEEEMMQDDILCPGTTTAAHGFPSAS